MDGIVYAVECTEYIGDRIVYVLSVQNISETGLFMLLSEQNTFGIEFFLYAECTEYIVDRIVYTVECTEYIRDRNFLYSECT